MANIYENENITFEDCETLRKTLRTPDNQMIYPNSDDTIYFDFDNNLNYYEPLPNTSFNNAIDTSVQLSEDSDDITFDHNEWRIIDQNSGQKRRPRQSEFLELLLEKSNYSSYVRWLDKTQGLFVIRLPNEVVALWEKVKCRKTTGKMSYQTFSRALRYYYKSGLMIKTHKKFTFRFNRSIKYI